jgi:hypothetical protein
MAIIYSYPLNDDIKLLDELVGTTEKSINGQLKTVTRNFLLSDLAEFFIVDGGLQKEITLTTNNSAGPATLNQTTGILNIPRYDIGSITSISAIAPITATIGTTPVISTSMSTNKLIGRYSTGTGVFEEITLGTGLSFTGNVLNSTALVTPAALTKVDDTNVTLTLGGSPGNALLQGVSLTLGWAGTLEDSRITSSSSWNTAYNNRITSLTTTGSGAATLISNILNIPTVGVVSATTSGIVNNTSLQELGGVDKKINGIRIGRGNISDPLSENTAVGYLALQSVVHTTGDQGYYNTAFGEEALKSLTTGHSNDAFGDWTLRFCTTGTFNTAIGGGALHLLQGGSYNTAIGPSALRNNLNGSRNTAVGTSALQNNTGSNNTAIGSVAGGATASSGSSNILIGFQAGRDVSTGTNNLLIENITNASITSGSYNIILNPKQKSGVTTGSNNTIIGCWDGTFAAGLAGNVIIGNGLGQIRLQSTSTGLTTVPGQTNILIDGDATGKAVVTKEYLTNVVGSQNLQQVTNIGATTTNPITVAVTNNDAVALTVTASGTTSTGISSNSDYIGVKGISAEGTAIEGASYTGVGVYGSSYSGVGVSGVVVSGVGMSALSYNGKGIEVNGNGNGTPSVEVNLGNTNKGLVINSGTSSTGNFIELDKNGVDKLTINQEGELTAQKLIKDGGTSAQLLAANGDTITAGTNITISGGTISSTGGAGGSSSVNFYLNGSIASNVAGYKQIGATAVIGAGTDFSLVGNGTIAQFLTDVESPNRLEIPSGAWNFELWLQSSINNSGTNVHIELYKYDGAFTLIATGVSNPISLQTNTTTNLYVTNVGIPQTTLLATDRLAIRVIASNAVGLHSVTLHTEDSNLCEVITNFVGGITAINGITQPSQTLATGTTGTDFDIVSSGSTHTFNLPSASATARGVVTTGTQTFAGAKTFSSQTILGDGVVGTPTYGLLPQATVGSTTGGVFDIRNTNTNIVAGNTVGTLQFSAKDDDSVAYSTAQIKAITQNGIGTGGSGKTDLIFYTSNGSSSIERVKMNDLGLVINSEVTSTIASFDSNKSIKSLTTADGYPSLVELKYVKGVTSAIQTQINAKANDASVVHLTGNETIAGEKTFSSNIRLPVSLANTSATVVYGNPSTGELFIGFDTIGPTALEMQYVKGVTSSIQTQLDGKVDENTAITGATKTKITYDSKGLVTAGADITTTDISDFNSATRAQVEAELVAGTNITITPSGTGATRQLTIAATGGGGSTSNSGTYSETPIWSLSAPTTLLANNFEWVEQNNVVTLRINLSYSVGSSNTSVRLPLPTGSPTPKDITGFTGASNIMCFGSGLLFTDINILPPSAGRSCFLRRNAANDGFEIVVQHSAAITAKSVSLTILYFK